MSLLMEALRKAEEAKRRMQQGEQAATARDPHDGAEAPRPATPSSRNSLFSLEEREPEVTPEYIRENFTTAQEPPPPVPENPTPATPPVADPEPQDVQRPEPVEPRARALQRRSQRAAAASVFAAKQNPARSRTVLTILVIVMVLMIPLGGGVLWYLQSATAPSIGVSPSVATYNLSERGFVGESAPEPTTAETETPATVVALTPPAPPADAPVEQAPVTPEPVLASEEAAGVSTEVTAVPEVPEPADTITPVADAADVAAPPAPAVVTAAAAVDVGPADTSPVLLAAAPAPVLRVSRSRATSQLNPDLVAAYERMQAGDFLVAGQRYQQVLDALPNNRDALLGMALVYLRRGDFAASRQLYARLLQLNPRDPLANTGLLQTMQASAPAEQERTLKQLISEYPSVAQLTLALGNLYAAQQRWSEAQGAYYNALLTAGRSTNGPVHPDYAFNLAVSLEQLNEPRAALDYYRQAQALATQVTPGFDLQLLNSRLDYLSSTQDQP